MKHLIVVTHLFIFAHLYYSAGKQTSQPPLVTSSGHSRSARDITFLAQALIHLMTTPATKRSTSLPQLTEELRLPAFRKKGRRSGSEAQCSLS